MTDDPPLTRHLRDESGQFQRLVNEVKDYAIFMLDLDGYVRTWNKGATSIKGYREDEIIGKHFSTFYPSEAVDEGLPDRLMTEAKIEGRTEHEGWRVRKDGSRFWANVTITAIHDEDGEVDGFAKVTRDLTERVQHERRLEEFAHAVSHDLRQPMRTMTIDLELLERSMGDSLDEVNQELLVDAIDGAKRMQAMVDGLLQYARTETADARVEPIDSAVVVDDAIEDLGALIDERDAEVTVESLPVVQVDREQLHVVFQNLIENAIKYTEDGPPRVRIGAEESDGQWRISVADNGIGVDPEKANEIFELFERSHRVEDAEGIGLGLALCKQIVERHGGEIWVESEPDDGSTFYFTLPAGQSDTNDK